MTRVSCGVCHRTIGRDRYIKQFGHEPGNWICPTHWKMVPKRLKRLNQRHKRQERKFGTIVRPEAYERLWSAIYRIISA